MNLRKTTYRQHGQPISLLFLDCLSDQHPEYVEPAPPPEPAIPRAPRYSVSRKRKPDSGFEATLRRIEIQGY
jgi:hypothetical protein